MAIRTIRQYPDPVLRARAPETGKVTKELKKLARDMLDTMHAAHGVGLAAPQVGVSARLFVADTTEKENGKGETLALVNPRIVSEQGEVVGEEGCLSFPPDIRGDVRRSAEVEVRGFGLEGKPVHFKARGLLARVIQHELDHLDGVLFVDRLSFSQKLKLKTRLRDLEGAGKRKVAA